MTSIRRILLQTQSPVLLSKRFRGKINIQKPRPPHFERQLLLDFTQPIYRPPKNKIISEIELCVKGKGKSWKKDVDNPFERILANECLNWFNTSKMVVFLHMNSISMEDKLPVFANLKRNNMHLRKYGKKIVSMATKGTRYEAVNQLFVSQQDIIFGQPESIDKMFKILKKVPQMVVMAGIIEERLMSKNELVEFSQMPSLEAARSQLCVVLQSAGSCLVGQLQQSQQTLVAQLQQHIDIQNSGSEQSPTQNSEPPTETKE